MFLDGQTQKNSTSLLDLMERGGSNIRPYIMEWYNQVFLPAFRAEGGQVKLKNIESGDRIITLKENYPAVTSKQLRDKTLEILNISISSDELRQKYTDPLVNQGLLEKAKSEIRKSENIFFPVDERGENIFSLFNNEVLKLTVNHPNLHPSKDLIISAFSRHIENQAQIKYRDNDGGFLEKKSLLDIYRLEDDDGTEITPEQLADKYFSNPDSCFSKDFQTDSAE